MEIHINDTNDNPPTFRDSEYETSIKEGDFEFSSGKSQFSLTVFFRDKLWTHELFCSELCLNFYYFGVILQLFIQVIFFFKATDDDLKETINSNISFCFVDVNDNCITHTHFNISESGDIMCIKEIDYEDLASQSNGGIGELHLKIKAYDHGISPLYSVVNLTIYVQVV